MKPTCERVTGHAPTEWGSRPITCKRSLGLTSWTDAHGVKRYACRDHREAIEFRYPAMTESEARLMDGNR